MFKALDVRRNGNSISVYLGPGGLHIDMVSSVDYSRSYNWEVRGYPKDYVEALRLSLTEEVETSQSKDWSAPPQPVFGFIPYDKEYGQWVKKAGEWIMATWVCGDKGPWAMFLRKTEAYDLAKVIEDYWVA